MTRPPDTLTPGEATVLEALIRAAEAGAECPSNSDLAGMLGGASVATPARNIGALERKGLIRVERGNSRRVVTIVSSGARTSGTIRQPHWRQRTDRTPAEPRKTARRYHEREGLERGGPPLPADFVPVSRDPCFFCGARPDVCECKQGSRAA